MLMMTDGLPGVESYAKNQRGYMSFLYCTNSFLKRFLLFFIMCISLCICTCMSIVASGSQKRCKILLELEWQAGVNHLMWELGAEFRSSGRALYSYPWLQSPLTSLAAPTPNHFNKIKTANKSVYSFDFFIFFLFYFWTNLICACYMAHHLLDNWDSGIRKTRVHPHSGGGEGW